MSTTEPQAASPLERGAWLVPLMAIGMVNALVRPTFDEITAAGWWTGITSGMGSGWPVYLGLAGALSLGFREPDPAPLSRWDVAILIAVGLGLLIPSSATSAAFLAALAGREVLTRRGGAEYHSCCVLFVALGLRELWVSTGLKILSPFLLRLDAYWASLTLGMLGDHPVVTGNLVSLDNGMTLAVLLPCSSFANLSLALLTWLAITRWLRPRFAPIDLLIAPLVGLTVIVVNVTRVTVMGLGEHAYELAHGPVGAMSTELAILTITLILTGWGLLHGTVKRPAAA